jgi:hypothetical protein
MFAYWWEIAMFSYDLATTWWPIPTIILAVLVIVVKASQDNWKSLNEWASSVGIALAIFLVGLVFFYAPYAHNAKLKEAIAQDHDALKDLPGIKGELATVTAQRDEARKALTLLQDRTSKLDDEIKNLTNRLGDKMAVEAEKARRKSIRSILSKLQGETEDIEKDLLRDSMKVAPALIVRITTWETKVFAYISKELGDADAAMFKRGIAYSLTPSEVSSYSREWGNWWMRLGSKNAAIDKLKDQLGPLGGAMPWYGKNDSSLN